MQCGARRGRGRQRRICRLRRRHVRRRAQNFIHAVNHDGDCWTLSGSNVKHVVQQCEQRRTASALKLARYSVCGRRDLRGRTGRVRELEEAQRKENARQRPDVDRRADQLPSERIDLLGGAVDRGRVLLDLLFQAAHFGRRRVHARVGRAAAEIAQAVLTVLIDEHVLWLQVAMNDGRPLTVHVLDARAHGEKDGEQLLFGKRFAARLPLGHGLRQRAARAEFHQEQVLGRPIGIRRACLGAVQHHNVRVRVEAFLEWVAVGVQSRVFAFSRGNMGEQAS